MLSQRMNLELNPFFFCRNLGILIAFMLFFLATTLIATEYITAAKSKGEVLVFRRGYVPAANKSYADDEESAEPVQKNIDEKSTVAQNVSGLQKQTSIFHWEDVCYDIEIDDGTRRLLDHVDGWVEPGTLTALMVGKKLSSMLELLSINTHLLGCFRRRKDGTFYAISVA